MKKALPFILGAVAGGAALWYYLGKPSVKKA